MTRWLGRVRLEVEAELHVVGEQLVGRALVPVQEDVLVVAAGEAALVGLDPAGGVVLLHQVALRLGQAVLVEWDAVNGPLDLMIAVMMVIVVQLTPALQTQVGASTPESCSWPPVLRRSVRQQYRVKTNKAFLTGFL